MIPASDLICLVATLYVLHSAIVAPVLRWRRKKIGNRNA